MEVTELKAAIEAIVFVAEEPVPFLKFKEIFSEESPDKLQTAIVELMEQFNRERPGVEIREIAGGIRMTTRPEHHEWIRAYLKTRPSAKLSLPALETLAVIAYRQPITLAEILAVRGVKSSSSIRTLLEKKFVTPCGRKKVVGRPILYGTTREFLVHFGLKDLSELPTLKEFEDLIGSELPERNVLPESAALTAHPPMASLHEDGAAVGEPESPSLEPDVTPVQEESGSGEPTETPSDLLQASEEPIETEIGPSAASAETAAVPEETAVEQPESDIHSIE
jgi:segregation and condensation protein B